ncbi:MAG: hypothetical protein CVU64_05195 [Deltaproteobacteria bacterium HGW-Deltaproteobacteria-21]|nr:MAG: hypothetical protein CVU64_05195 [Deltaproteobacteria bacterium HGW-Deltaproteobacteria-21]
MLCEEKVLRKDERAAWAFLKRTLLFLSPFFLFFLVFELALWRTGDALPSRHAFQRQIASKDEVLYGRDFLSQQFNIYKLTAIRELRPEILVLGSSRVMQIRSLLFGPFSFYNAGGMLQNACDLQEYARLVLKKDLPSPRVLIVGIDPWWLNEGYGSDVSWLNQEDEAYSFVAHVEALRRAIIGKRLGALLRGLFLPKKSPYWGYEAIGSLAIHKDNGFRRDGSRQYSPEILLDYMKDPKFVDREDPPVIERIRSHWGKFALPQRFDHSRAGAIVQSLEQLRDLGTEIWIFLPPFSTESGQALDTIPAYSMWWSTYKHGFAHAFRSRGFHVVAAFSPRDYGLDDRYMIDGFHPSEVFMAHVVARIVEIAPETSPLSKLDINFLRGIAESAATPLSFDVPERIRDKLRPRIAKPAERLHSEPHSPDTAFPISEQMNLE